jgi:hypothetical protein
MNQTTEWDKWLSDADSALDLAPEDYDFRQDMPRVRGRISTSSPELYQDGTGLAHSRITLKEAHHPIEGTLAWVALSRFGHFVRRIDAGEVIDLAFLRTRIESLRVTANALFRRRVGFAVSIRMWTRSLSSGYAHATPMVLALN